MSIAGQAGCGKAVALLLALLVVGIGYLVASLLPRNPPTTIDLIISEIPATSSNSNTIEPSSTQISMMRTLFEEAFEQAWQFTGTNGNWTPFTYEFDGVEMVLVPVGCFMMGSRNGNEDESPVHEICFDRPFWIDKYEVTNEVFTKFSGFAQDTSPYNGAKQPRTMISWVEAANLCQLRNARLPTEAEWEYTARGPSNLIFPWGDTFNPSYVLPLDVPIDTLPDVGAYPEDRSWVGAYDLAGSVWEWTSTIYMPYPYPMLGSDLERERNTSEAGYTRVIRSASPPYLEGFLPRSSDRYYRWYTRTFDTNGFRCARDV